MSVSKRTVKLNNTVIKKLAINFILSTAMGVIVLLLLLCLVSSILCTMEIPVASLVTITTACTAFSALISGLIFSMLQGQNGLVLGFVSGVAIYAGIFLSALFSGALDLSSFSVLKISSIVIAGMLGGYWGIGIREKRRNRH